MALVLAAADAWPVDNWVLDDGMLDLGVESL